MEIEPNKFVIRGGLIESRNSSGLRRLAKPKEDSPANFEEVDCQWRLLDIDEVDIPDSFIAGQSPLIDLIQHVIQLLPDAFNVSDCWYQFSSSMGIKAGKIRVHLWYWLSKPVSNLNMRAWLSESPVDLSLFRTLQPHYTANPIFLDGAVDPWPNRSGMFNSGNDVIAVQVPDSFQLQILNPKTSTVRRQVNKMDTIDAQEIVRDNTSGLIVDGREQFLYECSTFAIRKALQSSKDKPSANEVADLTWSQFINEANIEDGKWTSVHALQKAEARLAEVSEDSYGYKAKQVTHILQPIHTTTIQPVFVKPEQGAQMLNEELGKFFDTEGQSDPTVLRVTMGAGKTRQTIEHLKSLMTRSFSTRVEVYVPRHDIAAEWTTALNAPSDSGDMINARVIHVQPRLNNSDGVSGDLCLRPEYAKSLQDASVGVFHNACQSGDSLCDHYSDCPYIGQFTEPLMLQKSGNVIHIFVHNYLTLPRNPLQVTPDIAIIVSIA